MFIEPPRTQFDFQWTMLGVHVRVHPFFWVMAVVFGWGFLEDGFAYLLLWVAFVFVSILVHELGHVFTGRVFGTRGHIVLYALGGLAVGSSALRNRWQRIAVFFAGPAAQGIVLTLLLGAVRSAGPDRFAAPMWGVLAFAFYFNLFWVLLNLIPIWPLDGGQISRDLLGWLMPANGTRVALGISILLAGLLALNALVLTTAHHSLPVLEWIPGLNAIGGLFAVLFYGWLALTSYQALQFEANPPWRRWDQEEDDRYQGDNWKRW